MPRKQSPKQKAASKRNIKKAQAALRAQRGWGKASKGSGPFAKGNGKKGTKKAKRGGHVPLSLLKKRHAELGRLIKSRSK